MRSRSFWIGAVASVVVVVLAVGIVYLLSVLRDPRTDLPDKLGDLAALDTKAAQPGNDSAEDDERLSGVIEQRRQAQDYNAEKTSKAFDGADVSVRTYSDPDDFEQFYNVTAIGADAGPLIPETGFDDPEVTELAFPQIDRVTVGDVECLVRRPAVSAGAADDESSDAPQKPDINSLLCQRTEDSLTVRVGTSGSDVDMDATLDVLDEAWDALH